MLYYYLFIHIHIYVNIFAYKKQFYDSVLPTSGSPRCANTMRANVRVMCYTRHVQPDGEIIFKEGGNVSTVP